MVTAGATATSASRRRSPCRAVRRSHSGQYTSSENRSDKIEHRAVDWTQSQGAMLTAEIAAARDRGSTGLLGLRHAHETTEAQSVEAARHDRRQGGMGSLGSKPV